ncbi:MAG: Transcriptional activator of maltose regulon, MalT [Ktedonobacterales bacterium]|nr:MAG: Transcriptional activator of maltose regulon, MalT [Ktedonobacterales bacterium]
MDPGLLATKLYVPHPRANWVRRPRLLARLDDALHCQLTLISAPPGSGKTTLLAAWHASPTGKRFPLAWVSLDEGDNDPVRFWRYVLAALRSVHAGLGAGALALLRAPQSPAIETVLAALLNDLALLQDDLLLVLDDYHRITDASVEAGLVYLLEHLPPHAHLALITRIDPPLPLASLRARGQLIELRAADLRFTAAEAGDFLRDGMGLALAPEAVAALEARTEGWIAGIQLAALAMRQSNDITGFLATFQGSNRYVFDYLTEEALRHQPAAVQSFLLHTAILDRFCAPLCESVTGERGSREMLATVERANLFVVPLDNDRRWYRYHHLFGEFLRQRLAETQPEQVRALHLRAAAWHERNGSLPEAIEHLLAAPAEEDAALLIERYFEEMQERSEVGSLLRWCAALPEAIARAHPYLNLASAWMLLAAARYDAIEPKLQVIERALDEARAGGDTEPLRRGATDYQGQVYAIRSNIALNLGDPEQAIALAQLALEQLTAEDALPRSVVALNLADAYHDRDELAAASALYQETLTLCARIGNAPIAVNAASNLGQLYEQQARLHDAERTYEQARTLGAGSGAALPFTGKAIVGLAHIRYQWNDLDAALRTLNEGIPLCLQWGHSEHVVESYLTLAQIRWAMGDHAGASDALQAAEAHRRTRGHRSMVHWRVQVWQAELALREGNLPAAEAWARECEADIRADGAGMHPGHITLAKILAARNQHGDALRLLERYLAATQASGRADLTLATLIAQALLLREAGESTRALDALAAALTLAQPSGYIRVFRDAGEPMRALLAEALARGVTPAYTQMLLAAFAPAASGSLGMGEDPASPPLLVPLTRRERDVLRLIAAGASNQEIADRLVIALGTVKKHISTIFDKVGVASRTQLLVRARDLGLL